MNVIYIVKNEKGDITGVMIPTEKGGHKTRTDDDAISHAAHVILTGELWEGKDAWKVGYLPYFTKQDLMV